MKSTGTVLGHMTFPMSSFPEHATQIPSCNRVTVVCFCQKIKGPNETDKIFTPELIIAQWGLLITNQLKTKYFLERFFHSKVCKFNCGKDNQTFPDHEGLVQCASHLFTNIDTKGSRRHVNSLVLELQL